MEPRTNGHGMVGRLFPTPDALEHEQSEQRSSNVWTEERWMGVGEEMRIYARPATRH